MNHIFMCLFLFQLVAVAVLVTLVSVATSAPQNGPPVPPIGRAYNPRFVPLSPQGFVPIISENYDLNPLDNSYNFK